MTITVHNGELNKQEIDAYVKYVQKNNPNRDFKYLDITVDGEYVDIQYELIPVKFYRIRRVTGYLSGDTSKWNNAKQAELKDRLKHGL
jgi:hypothetical protein